MAFQTKATIASFGGQLLKLTHAASTTSCEMALNLFLPPAVTLNPLHKVPVLFFLAGLTCTGDNCAEKGFFQHGAAQHGIAVVYPDTSPRGLQIAGEDDAYDFGSGAGFYVDATQAPWDKGYKMASYITSELPKALFAHFKQLDSSRVSITGHSMGGHGALTLFLKNPQLYKSVSAFAPIANPSNCPWGQKAFGGYFGADAKEQWSAHDATELLKRYKGGPLDVLIDIVRTVSSRCIALRAQTSTPPFPSPPFFACTLALLYITHLNRLRELHPLTARLTAGAQGTNDNFYKQKQLLPENFAAAAKQAGREKEVRIRYNDGHDHSYFTIATFADDHVAHAARYLFE
ncbi:hypothetical protein MMC11_003623 [Xylographa trunciseda]|nr:hypothetical protein [Xylographa trunciseda]